MISTNPGHRNIGQGFGSRVSSFVVTFCRNIWSVFPRFPVFSGHETSIPGHSEMRLIILKRKELTDRSGKTWERKGSVGQLTLDQHIGVRIPGGQPSDNFPAFFRTVEDLSAQTRFVYFKQCNERSAFAKVRMHGEACRSCGRGNPQPAQEHGSTTRRTLRCAAWRGRRSAAGGGVAHGRCAGKERRP